MVQCNVLVLVSPYRLRQLNVARDIFVFVFNLLKWIKYLYTIGLDVFVGLRCCGCCYLTSKLLPVGYERNPNTNMSLRNLNILFFSHNTYLGLLCQSPQVQVWDTAGQERFRKSMVEHYYRNVHAVVFVYDVTKMASFRNLQTWIEVGNYLSLLHNS